MAVKKTSRQLAFDAIEHRRPQRIPWTLYLAEPLEQKLTEIWGPRENWPCPADDIIRVLWPCKYQDITDTGFRDMFGCPWKIERGGYTFFDPPLKVPDAGQVPQINLLPQSEVDRILQARKNYPECFIFYQFTMTLGERLWTLRGMENILMDYMLEKSFCHKALDILLEMHMQALDKLLVLPIDGITFGDDYGTQGGLMISRSIFLEFFKPRLAKLYEKVRLANKVAMHHSCGNVTEIMADLIEIGMQVFHPLQPEAMDIRKIKKDFGKDLTFRGGIGTQGKIVFGNPNQAREEVKRAVDILSKEGGYFLETGKPLPEETPMENVVAVIEEMCHAMNYEF
jgi:uroporphyrinogen decarboxylase